MSRASRSWKMSGPRTPDRCGATTLRTTLALTLSAVAWVGCSGAPSPIAKPQEPSPETVRLRQRLVDMEQRAIMGEVEARRLKTEVERLEKELAVAQEQALHTAPTAVPARPIGDGIGSITVTPLVESDELEEPEAPAASTDLSTGDLSTEDLSTVPFIAGGTAIPLEGSAAQEIYDQGYSLFHERRYAEAEYVFGQVAARHGSHELADNALFWIGESRYAQGRYADALGAFTATVERYPEGNKVSDAMLKAGKCLEAMGQADRAAATYREVSRLFPETAAAIVAEERLQALR